MAETASTFSLLVAGNVRASFAALATDTTKAIPVFTELLIVVSKAANLHSHPKLQSATSI